MSLFGKKPEPAPVATSREQAAASPVAPAPAAPGYGIAELVRLMKVIPVDQQPDLVVRVIKSTLESVGVQGAAVVDDALRQEHLIKEKVSTLEQEIDDLTKEIQLRRGLIGDLQTELAETTYAKELLIRTGTPAPIVPSSDAGNAVSVKPRSLPPPMPPPIKHAAPRASEPSLEE